MIHPLNDGKSLTVVGRTSYPGERNTTTRHGLLPVEGYTSTKVNEKLYYLGVWRSDP